MFRLLDDSRVDWVEFQLDDESVRVPAGITLAAALFYLGILPSRLTPVSSSPRAPFCMMGACFECILEVEGEGLQRACQITVRAGLRAWRPVDDADAGGES